MHRRSLSIAHALLLLLSLLLGGCGSPAKSPAATATSPSTTRPAPVDEGKLTINDPCAARLHDLCGPLLLYYATNYRLPERIEELQQLPGFERLEYGCPVSQQPYVYNPKGVRGPNITQFALVYDAAPTHAGYRWAIVVQEPAGNAPLIARVVAWPEARFANVTDRSDAARPVE